VGLATTSRFSLSSHRSMRGAESDMTQLTIRFVCESTINHSVKICSSSLGLSSEVACYEVIRSVVVAGNVNVSGSHFGWTGDVKSRCWEKMRHVVRSDRTCSDVGSHKGRVRRALA
jgi:hypothetical protein